MLDIAGLFVPELREMREIYYQFDRPFVMESSAAQRAFGITPTPLGEVAASTVAWWRGRVDPGVPADVQGVLA